MKAICLISGILLLFFLVGCVPQMSVAAGDLTLRHAALQATSNTQGVLRDAQGVQRTISVTGNAQVMVVPDEVVLTLGVETSDMKLAVAKSKNDEIVTRVLKITKGMEIDPKYAQADYMNIEPRYQDNYNQRTFLGFWVRKNIVITLKDITKFEDLLSQCLEAGVNYVLGIEFRTTELRKHRDEARALAIRAAQEKAAAMARELGQEIGQPFSIREDYNRWYSPWSSWWGGGYGGGMAQNTVQNAPATAPQETDSELAPGQIAVDASVTVDFELK